MRQSTIARPVECSGTGLHNGDRVRMRLEPAAESTGIVFVDVPALDRLDSEIVASGAGRNGDCNADRRSANVEIPALVEYVHSSSRATVLARSRSDSPLARSAEWARVATVEHLLASLYAHGIDNVRVIVEGGELPALDGSAAPFVELLTSAERVEQDAEAAFLILEESIEIRDGERWIRADPHEQGLRIDYAIDFGHPLIGRQALELPQLDPSSFDAEVAHARTFGFQEEVEALRSAGLGLGGSLENTIVLGASEILNDSGLRYADEFVRHKVVDLVGDLALLGHRLSAHVQVERGGHRLHHELVRAIAESAGILSCRSTDASSAAGGAAGGAGGTLRSSGAYST